MSAASRDEVERAILRAGLVDYLDFWFITHVVEDVLATRDATLVREAALAAIARLLRAQRLRAGDLRPPGEFEAWTLDSASALERIRNELANLDHPLGVGDVAWFEVPEGRPGPPSSS
jgi:hypothetical protein